MKSLICTVFVYLLCDARTDKGHRRMRNETLKKLLVVDIFLYDSFFLNVVLRALRIELSTEIKYCFGSLQELCWKFYIFTETGTLDIFRKLSSKYLWNLSSENMRADDLLFKKHKSSSTLLAKYFPIGFFLFPSHEKIIPKKEKGPFSSAGEKQGG